MNGRVIGLVVITLFVVVFSLVLALGGLGWMLPMENVRMIAREYLRIAYNPFDMNYTVMSPEAVTSIVWDFRGLDTLFETVVFYLAIIGSVALARGIKSSPPEKKVEAYGLSLIVKTVTRITIGMIIAIAASIALHGHLTPGGGFQGGATAAIAPLLVLVIFSKYYLENLGVRKNVMLSIRSIGLLGIGLTAFSVLIIGLLSGVNAYVFQNQPKSTAPIGLPYQIGGQLISGTLWFFNIFEMFAVAAGFTIIFLLLSIPERDVLKCIKEEGGEY